LAGKKVIAYACAPFPTIRAFDQIKNAIVMMELPISIVSSGIGFAIPEWGATHYNAEDLSLMRSLPGIRIITPTDNVMGAAAARHSVSASQALYIRFDKDAEGDIYREDQIDFARGFNVLADGNDLAIITCGSTTARVRGLLEEINSYGFSLKLIDLYALPFDSDRLLSEMKGIPHILTIEEHILSGGIGTAILELLSEYGIEKRIHRMGIDFGRGYPHDFGDRNYYLREYGLSDEAIAGKIIEIMGEQKEPEF
jgi:transketolase